MWIAPVTSRREIDEFVRLARPDVFVHDARATDGLIRELQMAADEGMAVVTSSPFRVRHRPDIRRMADLVEPLDRALRSTRVLVRQTAVAAYSTRAWAGAPVSTPVTWSELGAGLRSDRYAVANLEKRLGSLKKDPWEGFFKMRQGIPKSLFKKTGQ